MALGSHSCGRVRDVPSRSGLAPGEEEDGKEGADQISFIESEPSVTDLKAPVGPGRELGSPEWSPLLPPVPVDFEGVIGAKE